MKLISKIGELREKQGLTQRQIAMELGVTETTVANWERGRSGLDWIDRLNRLCKLLECELDELIEYEEEDVEPDSDREPTFEELKAMYRQGKLSKPVSAASSTSRSRK
ncbi:MAG: helix-turn-helix transcriptional regulator [Cyanobacteria bacterium P01_F01_bin.150]